MNKRFLYMAAAFAMAMTANAQTGSDYMQAMKVADTNITFDVNDEGKAFRVKWGMDTAWNWDFNVNRGVAHIGKGNFETGRISFQPTAEVIDNGDGTYELTAAQKRVLRSRCQNILLTGCNKVAINNDQEDALNKDNGNYDKYQSLYLNKPEAWYKLIKASVAYAKECGVDVISISPFNEPDYGDWGQGTKASMKEICRLIKNDPYFDGIRVCAGNTLNCDYALEWYNYCLDYIDEGNTHQLAGTFDNYAKFFQKVKADGKVATADELHNVGEAIVGVEYGMETGIWWAFHAKARGQFCLDSNEGVRIGYGENRPAWTSGAVYRNEKTGEVHGYLGSSERQAVASSFSFISKGKDVFFNGYGPTRMMVYDVPGGKKGSYQNGQINAERLFDITWGEDVAPGVIDGTYQIMNAYSKKLLTFQGTSNVQSATRKTSGTTQQWKVYPGYTTMDISYWFIDNVATNTKRVNLNVLNNSLNAGAGVICYDAGHSENEQWYLKYAKDGYYYIISALSNKYLYCGGTSSGTNVSLQDAPTAETTEANLKKYLWRFQPTDAKAETNAPAAPTGLKAKQRVGSIELEWTAPTDDDVACYTILRGVKTEDGSTDWNTVGRNDTLTTFIDNTVQTGNTYIYKVQAVDYAGNRSEASETLEATPLEEKALLCQLQFDDDMTDKSFNQYNASLYGSSTFSGVSSLVKSGTKSLSMDGKTYVMLPCAVADQDEMTITTWIRWTSGGSNWQRIFDFGNDTDQYMFLCPSNGSEMRFVMKNGGDEQILSNGKKLGASTWHHVAVTIKPVGDKVQAILYLDGENIAETDEFTIKPSDIAPSLCFVGRSMFTADPLLSARIDDFRVYNYALSAEEVAGVMEDNGEVSKDIKDSYTEVVSTGIESIRPAKSAEDGKWYDLSGRRANASDKGILIQNGKKILK
ncbi:MAG: RICIN domain-containing protein [Bacteroidaceae bacterium]|nr:RICIN domain-containing protein [Bacteroidaceae bacterium]